MDHISMVKIVAPLMAETVISRAIQIHGAMGVSQDTPLGGMYQAARYCRIADGPDEVHMSQLGRLTAKRYIKSDKQ